MASRKNFEIAISTLLLLALVLPTPHADAFTSNQSAVIVIGQSKDSPYALGWPAGGLAFDSLGNLWVADLQNSRVLEFMSPFSSNMNASIVLGQPDFHHLWGSGWFANEMTYPSSVTFDRTGNLWVADSDNNRITEFTPPFHNGMNASLVIGQRAIAIPSPLPDWSSAVPATSRNGLSVPDGIVFDSFGDLWVADSWNGRVLEFQPPFSNNMNASLVIGERDFTTSCNQETRNDTLTLCGDSRTLNGPVEVAFDATGNLWVTDTINLGTYAVPRYQGRLLEFTSPFNDGMEAALVIHVPAGSSSLAFDSSGNLWLGCAGCTSKAGGYVSEYNPPFDEHMNPSLVMAGNTTNVTSQSPTNPTGLLFDSAGNLWVVDSTRVLGFDSGMHSVMTSAGNVFFKNYNGLLAPLTSIPTSRAPKALELPPATFPFGLFNFTIEGLPAGGPVTMTISFPHSLPPGMEWLSRQGDQWERLPANLTQVDGNNMTLMFTHASPDGVISEVGGPAFTPTSVTSSTESTTTSSPQPQTLPPSLALGIPLTVIIVAAAIVLYRKRGQTPKPRDL